MDIVVAAALLLVAVGLICKRPLKIEVTHKHVVESSQKDEGLADQNLESTDPEVEKNMNRIIQNINAIMNGGEPFDEG